MTLTEKALRQKLEDLTFMLSEISQKRNASIFGLLCLLDKLIVTMNRLNMITNEFETDENQGAFRKLVLSYRESLDKAISMQEKVFSELSNKKKAA